MDLSSTAKTLRLCAAAIAEAFERKLQKSIAAFEESTETFDEEANKEHAYNWTVPIKVFFASQVMDRKPIFICARSRL